MEKYKVAVNLGRVEDEAQTADLKTIELALGNILAEKAVAKAKGETLDQKRKRMTKELRFRTRILKDAGLDLNNLNRK